MSQVGLVTECRMRKRLRGLCTMCQQNLLDRWSSEYEDNIVVSHEEDEHHASNLFSDAVAQDSPDMLVGSFLEDEGLARTALSCLLSMNLCGAFQG